MAEHTQTIVNIAAIARRHGMEEAADVVFAESKRLIRAADKEHRKFLSGDGDFNNTLYEALESEASTVEAIGRKIIRRSKRAARAEQS